MIFRRKTDKKSAQDTDKHRTVTNRIRIGPVETTKAECEFGRQRAVFLTSQFSVNVLICYVS